MYIMVYTVFWHVVNSKILLEILTWKKFFLISNCAFSRFMVTSDSSILDIVSASFDISSIVQCKAMKCVKRNKAQSSSTKSKESKLTSLLLLEISKLFYAVYYVSIYIRVQRDQP